MEIVKIPIADYLKYCLDTAHQRGFIWVLLLLARDADAEVTYQEIKKYWNSLDDLTGKNILFVFAGKQVVENQSDSLLIHETESYRALTNPSISFINSNKPSVPYSIYPSFDYDKYQINKVEVTHTRSITELRDFLELSEKDVPSLIFVPTSTLAREKKVIIKLQNENIYGMVKNIIESFEELFRKIKIVQDNCVQINRKLSELNYEILSLSSGAKAIARFIESKSYLDRLIHDTSNNIIKKRLQDAINSKLNYNRQTFEPHIRIHLGRYHDLLKQYPTLENDLLQINKIENEKKELNLLLIEEHDKEKLLYDELAYEINSVNQHTPSEEIIDNQGLRRFKVAFSFPGEHRSLVKEVANGLASIYGKDNIFYDKYHRAELSRPNLDTYLQKLYRYDSELIVIFICSDYQRKKWCGIEWRAIRDLLNQKDTDERIMFIKCGKGSVDGVFGTIDGYIDSSEVSESDIVKDIEKRLNFIYEQSHDSI